MVLAAAAVLLAAVMGVTGSFELLLYGGPLLFITGLLLSGRFIGEERILARRAAPGAAAARRAPDAGRGCASCRSRRCSSAARACCAARPRPRPPDPRLKPVPVR